MKDIRSVTAMSGQDNTVWGNEEPIIDLKTSPSRQDINSAMLQLRSLEGSTGISMMDWTERLIELTSVSDEQTHQQIAGQQCMGQQIAGQQCLGQQIAGQQCPVNTSNVFQTLEHSRQHFGDDATFRSTPRSLQPGRHTAHTSRDQISSRHFDKKVCENNRRQGAHISSPLPSSAREDSSYTNLFTGDHSVSQLDRPSALPSCKYLGKQHLSSQGTIQKPLSETPMSDFSSHMSVTNYASHDSITSYTSHDSFTNYTSHDSMRNYTTHDSNKNNTSHAITQETLETFGSQTAINDLNLFHTPLSLDLIMTNKNFNLGTLDVLDSFSSAGLITNSTEQPDTTNMLHGTPVSSFSVTEPLRCSENVCSFSDDFIDFATVEVETTGKSSDCYQQTIANAPVSSTNTGTVTIRHADDAIFDAPSTNSFRFKLPSVSASGLPASSTTTGEQFILNSSLARTISSGISMPDDIEDHLVASSSDSQSPWEPYSQSPWEPYSQSPWEPYSASLHPWDTGVLSLTDEDLAVGENSIQSKTTPSLDLKTPTDIPRDALQKNQDTSLKLSLIGSKYQRSSERLASQGKAQVLPTADGVNETVSVQPCPSQYTPTSSDVSTRSPLTPCQASQQPPCITSSVAYSVHVSSVINYMNFQTKQTHPVTLTSTSRKPADSNSGRRRALTAPGSSSGESTPRRDPQLCTLSAPRRQTHPLLDNRCLSSRNPAVKSPRLSTYPKPNLSDLSSDALLSPGDVNRTFLTSVETHISGKPQAPMTGMSSEISDVSLQDSDASSSVSTSLTEGEGSGERAAAQNLKEKLRFRLKGKGLTTEGLKPPEECRALDTGTTSVPEACQVTSLTRRKRYSDVDTDSSSTSRAKSFRRSSSSTLSGSSEEDHDVTLDSQNPLSDEKKSNKRSESRKGADEGGDDEGEEEDEETRLAKREKNRLAAQKCRHMKRDKMLMLSKQVYRLEVRQSKIKSEVERLNEEREQLEEMLRVHAFVCKRKQQSPEQSKHQH